jgi:hypothetical protein
MAALALDHVSVWLDELAPDRGAFAHALEWASRLRLPLKAFAPSSSQQDTTASGPSRDGKGCLALPGPAAPALGPERLHACEAACLQHGVAWGAFHWQGSVSFGIERFLRPVQLCVLGADLPAPGGPELLARSLHSPPGPVLVCPQSWRPMSRVLIVNQQRDVRSCFLDLAARVCQAVAVVPVVLTVARSEREAQARQRLAEETLAASRLPADFDCAVGCDAATAAATVARWRRCSHAFVESGRLTSWWSWARGPLPEQLLRQSASLTVLALPGASWPAAAANKECTRPAPGLAWGLG